jgi:hypothetical protein
MVELEIVREGPVTREIPNSKKLMDNIPFLVL